jgi:hypothetical protein
MSDEWASFSNSSAYVEAPNKDHPNEIVVGHIESRYVHTYDMCGFEGEETDLCGYTLDEIDDAFTDFVTRYHTYHREIYAKKERIAERYHNL